MKNTSTQKLYYCSECNHVYYGLPADGKCKICGNQIGPDDVVSNDEILTCETCHKIYPSQNWKDLIPSPDLKEDSLCGCQNQCPTKTSYQTQQKFISTGSIVIGNFFQCSNCHAVYIRGLEDREKNCAICHSSYVNLILIDPKKEKPVFECANPAHKIRLKIRDLIIDVNSQISKAIKPIAEQENSLRYEYNNKRTEIEKEKSILRNPAIKKEKLRNLDDWAKTQRWQLFGKLQSRPLYCASYKIESNVAQGAPTKVAGCGAIADMKIQKVVDYDVQQTQIKARPQTQAELLSSDTEVETYKPEIVEEPIVETVVETPSAAPETIPNITLLQRMNEYQEDSELLEKFNFISQPSELDAFNNLPNLNNNQIFMKIVLFALKSLNVTLDSDRSAVNFGVLPIVLSAEKTLIRIGRESFLKASWTNTDFIENQPFIFDNIAPLKGKSDEFQIKWEDSHLILKCNEARLNNPHFQMLDGSNIDTLESIPSEGIPLNGIKTVEFSNYYPLDKFNRGLFPKIVFQISFQIPDNVTTGDV